MTSSVSLTLRDLRLLEHHAVYMGPWDIMSEHFVKREEPPPGISSFTKIRLGWISPEKIMLVNPGESVHTFLSPLAQKGDLLVIKIPLKNGHYYLVENRQAVGFDRGLPDSGILILKVNPKAEEGSGTALLMNANPKARHFSEATYRIDRTNRNLFLDAETGIAIIPLWPEGEKQGVLVTIKEKSRDALEAALMIHKFMQTHTDPKERERNQRFASSIDSFKKFDFRTSMQMADAAFKLQ